MAARALIRFTVAIKGANSELVVAQNAAVTVYRTGTTTPPVLHNARTAGAVITNPLLSDANGQVVGWLDEAEASCLVDLVVSDNGGTAYRGGHSDTPIAFAAFTVSPVVAAACSS